MIDMIETKEKLDDFKETAIEFLKQNKILYDWLKDKDYFEMPASINHHGAWEGGLFEHSCSVAAELQNMTDKLGLNWERKESPMLVGLLHDVCKLDDYSLLPFGENEGELGFEYNTSRMYPGHGDKSLIMLMGFIDLTEEEKMCIRYHMGAFTDQKEWGYYSEAVRRYPNVLYAHTADMIASQINLE